MPLGPVIGAAGTVAGAAIGGKGAKKVAKIQAQTAANQLAQTKQFYDDGVARYAPDIAAGDTASAIYNGAIGNGDSTAATNAYKAYQNSTGFQQSLANSQAAVNASAYAGGLGKSGAALKALQNNANYLTQQNYNTWLGNENTSVQTGLTAKGALSGVALNALNSNNATTSNAANASSNATLASSANTANAFQTLGNLAANAYQSSYSGGETNYGNAVQSLGYAPISVYSNPDYSVG